jgi:hypothetical protein
MEEKESIWVFQQVKDPSSSLLVLYDAASFETKKTKTTTATSKFSMNFTFDSELLQHKIYKDSFRSLLRKAKASTTDAAVDNERSPAAWKVQEETVISRSIDGAIKRDKMEQQRELKILCLGPYATHFSKLLELRQSSSFGREEREEYQVYIYRYILSELYRVAKYFHDAENSPHTELHGHFETIANALETNVSLPLDLGTENTCRWLSEQEWVQSALEYPAS